MEVGNDPTMSQGMQKHAEHAEHTEQQNNRTIVQQSSTKEPKQITMIYRMSHQTGEITKQTNTREGCKNQNKQGHKNLGQNQACRTNNVTRT